MEEKKNVTLETELLTDMQDNIKRILLEVESMEIDLGRAEFVLDELLDLTMNGPKYESGKLVHDYPRIHSFLDLTDDYVSKARSIAADLLIKANREADTVEDEPETRQKKSKIQPAEITGEQRQTVQRKQVFSFRAGIDDIARWKAYSTATGQTMESVGSAAMIEYLKNHPLTDNEKVIFNALLENWAEENSKPSQDHLGED